MQRILDHDGYGEDPGGIESWLRLAEAVGLSRETVEGLGEVTPGVRFAVDAYVNFRAPRASGRRPCVPRLTELFAPEIHKQRLAIIGRSIDAWIDPAGLEYFQSRVSLARRDVEFSLGVTLERFNTRALQERALDILKFKLDVLWQMSDAMALQLTWLRHDGPPMSEPVIERSIAALPSNALWPQWEAAQNAHVLLFPEVE